jgi:hypothetical protein
MNDKQVDGWITVFTSGTDYEADLVRDRLADGGLDAVVLTHRDRSFSLNVGKMAVVRVLVAPSQADAARDILEPPPVSDAELEDAALNSNPILDDSEAGNEEDPS